MNRILFYRQNDPYGEFSNFYPSLITIAGIQYPTVEHYFQSCKFPTSEYHRTLVISAVSPGEAARLGRNRSYPMRPDWDQVRDDVMRVGLEAKFRQHQNLRNVLLGTGDLTLIEHTRNDRYWADGGDGSGKNMLGILLMELRQTLRNEELQQEAEVQQVDEASAVATKIAALSSRANLKLSPNSLILALTPQLTHTSFNNPYKPNNSRLSLLGQSILNSQATEFVLGKYPNLPGETCKSVVNSLVDETTLASVGKSLGVDSILLVGKKEDVRKQHGISKILAIIGALYQEKGLREAKEFIKAHFLSRQIDPIAHFHSAIDNPLFTLRKVLQGLNLQPATARLLQETGRASHSPVFIVGVFINDKKIGEGYGSSLKIAEQKAARDALEKHYVAEVKNVVLPSDIDLETSPDNRSFFEK
ncbi:hypothetical protein HK098_003937 [Nowakowskiella sp. JEL0407]|nr:hypothetical protein HK098_003937 [Nowakowskiella sp. JEL0407]